MKKALLVGLLIFSCLNVFAQIKFVKGHIIDNNGTKINCLIKNQDWKNNPKKISYKLNENGAVENGNIDDIREFYIYDSYKYQRFKVNLDRSSDNIRHLSSSSLPEFSEEDLFLKVLVEGKATLYLYTEEGITRFFYKLDDSEVSQLVSKSYITVDNQVKKNETYKQQLLNGLKCAELSYSQFEKIGYYQPDLIKLFKKFNSCSGEQVVEVEKEQEKAAEAKKRSFFHVSLRPGLNYTRFKVQQLQPKGLAEFDPQLTVRFGIESEWILPFHQNKWAVIFEPTYQYFQSASHFSTRRASEAVTASYKSIEFPIGLRHYFYLSEKSKIFVNHSFLADGSWDSKLNFESGSEMQLYNGFNFASGAGYKNRRVSLEFRYNFNRNIMNRYGNWSSRYGSYGLILGVNVF